MPLKSRLEKAIVGLVAFSLLGSCATHVFGIDPGPIPAIASALTLLFWTALVVSPFANRRGLLLVILAWGATSEIIGVQTAWPFGHYDYTGVWAPNIVLPTGHAFPMFLPIAWLMVVCASFLAAKAFTHGFHTVWVAALIATLVDLPMEWANVRALGYWSWTASPHDLFMFGFGVPFINSVGWFVVSFVACALLYRGTSARDSEQSRLGWLVLLSHATLMLGIALISYLPKLGRA